MAIIDGNADLSMYLFKEKTGKIIPGDGLFQYIESVWEAITENKELNLPSQRRTLSSYRCDQFLTGALKEKFIDEARCCRQLSLSTFVKRSLKERCLESVARLLSPLL